MSENDSYGATIAKWRLSVLLSDLRLSRRLTASQVCARLGWGRGKLGRFEMNQWKRPELSDMRDLLRLYRVDEDVERQVLTLAALARRRPWWREYPDVFDDEFPGFENDAHEIEVFLPLGLPALLQTAAYAETNAERLRQPGCPQARLVEAVLRRQQILSRRDGTAPRVTAVITEATLRYHWGRTSDRLQQIDHLIDLAHRPGIRILIHPFTAGLPPVLTAPICRFAFGPDTPDALFLETTCTTGLVRQDRSQPYLDAWRRTLTESAAPDSSIIRLKHLRTTLS